MLSIALASGLPTARGQAVTLGDYEPDYGFLGRHMTRLASTTMVETPNAILYIKPLNGGEGFSRIFVSS
jgi:hypothetical protein